MTQSQTWQEAQQWELDWHLRQQFNTFNEEKKQYYYAHLMGLDEYATNYYGIHGWDFKDQCIVDIGGGEVSMLLKSKAKRRIVIDPLPYPMWVKMRYSEAGIDFWNIKAEKLEIETRYNTKAFDIALIYNCLQHTEDPEKIICNALKWSRLIYIFEWIDEPVSPGHLHTLTEEKLNTWLGGHGKSSTINEGPMSGRYYTGIFKGKNYGV